MNIALNPPSPSIERPYLSHSNSNTSPQRTHYIQSAASTPRRESSPPQPNLAENTTSLFVSTPPSPESLGEMATTAVFTPHQNHIGNLHGDLGSPHHIDGQNHDRIDTDMAEDGENLFDEMDGNVHQETGIDVGASILEGEQMDTTSDGSSAVAVPTAIHQDTTISEMDHEQPPPPPNGVNADTEAQAQAPATIPSPPPAAQEIEIARILDGTQLPLVDRITSESDILAAETMVAIHQSEATDLSLERTEADPSRAVLGGSDDDESNDGSSTDEEHGFWANFQADDSIPTAEELKEIELMPEYSALDHERWEKATYQELEDPEYIASGTGRISWTLKGFHGTPDRPNKEKILRSPPVRIGGFDWNIKLFPRGNEGTDYISVYIECSQPSSDAQSTAATAPFEDSSNSEARDAIPPPTWNIAAQIGCVMYSPNEPKVQYFSRSAHHFANDNKDWGWVRFHGPWDSIHRRQPLQRQALLRNDTLELIAYIRTVEDYTGALWWHPSSLQPHWDSVAKTGHRGVIAHHTGGSALNAALCAWSHLTPIRDVILKSNRELFHVVNPTKGDSDRICPLFDALKNFLYAKHSPQPSPDPVSAGGVTKAMRWHVWNEPPYEATGCDVISTWEAIRFLLNQETSKTTEPDDVDVFRDIRTLRIRTDPEKNSSLFELHSTQDLLDCAVRNEHSEFKDWEGFYGSRGPNTNAPSILQLELPRQKYALDVRKWKRLTHRIEINDWVTLKLDSSQQQNAIGYTLYGIIVHTGSLESEVYSAIVKPGGRGSKWIRYNGSQQSEVTFLTWRQAIDAHEGGESMDEHDPVAYIAMYVKSESVSTILPKLDESWKPSSGVQDPLEEPSDNPEKENERNMEELNVAIINSNIFNNYTGRGVFDSWKLSQLDGALHVRLPRQTSFRDIQELLVSKYSIAERPEQCRLFAMQYEYAPSRWLPSLEEFSPDTTLSVLSASVGGCRLWLHVIPLELMPPKPPIEPAASNVVQPPPPPPPAPEPSFHDQPPPPSGIPPIPVPVPIAEPHLGDADVVMGGTQEQEALPAANPVAPAWERPDDIHFFVKEFDYPSQTLKSLGCHLASRKERIIDVLVKLHLASREKKWDLLIEDSGPNASVILKPRRTFESEGMTHGNILIIQKTLKPEQRATIETEGNFADVGEYYMYMGRNLVSRHEQYTRLYFGSFYFKMTLKHGRPHGHCIKIDMIGNAYTGNFTAGQKSGYGVMKYANGDTYEGNWEAEYPEGEGAMVYGQTKNKYQGGWKKGRRHGKGTMQFEVADEEMQLCKICFENEMDSLFYRCGHVVACEECARQVKDCPVCRRAVDAVVKIWRTT